ncbi:hypothetical protein FFLO_00136 [Filobasidium floriforme]|uniref:Transcription initiation factor IIA subunit 2 n=1 Tax=Filobasidium floriforme TaxID=5210 RepID=A0A8K0NW29_9TREE|nr:hypothetical protein FFLO_00136 [Filobasidium floriforme]
MADEQRGATYLEIYRGSALGRSLCDALDEMVHHGQMTPPLANEILLQFDRSMTLALQKSVKAKSSIKGHLKTYRSVDEVWNFSIQQPNLKLESLSALAAGDKNGTETLVIDQIDIVACKAPNT